MTNVIMMKEIVREDVLRGIEDSKMPQESTLLVINSARIIIIPIDAKVVILLLENVTNTLQESQVVMQITMTATQDAKLAGKALTAIIQ